jgi:hypothetical protein
LSEDENDAGEALVTGEGEPEINPDKAKSPVGFVIALTSIVLGLAGLAVAAYFYFGNVCIYALDGEDYLYITRRYVSPKSPVLDLRRLKTDEDELAIEVKKRLAAKIHMQQIETIITDDNSHRCRLRTKDEDFVYKVFLSEPSGDSGEIATLESESDKE